MSNNISMKTSVTDCPVSRRDEDCLNMSAFADALSKFIEQSQTPITIALQGEWGCGKTSMMNSIRSYLTDDERTSLFIPIWVNTWNHALIQDESESVVALLQDIIHQIREVSPNSVGDVADQILKGTLFLSKAALSVTANALGLRYLRVGGLGSNATRDLLSQEAHVSIPKLREEIASLIATLLKAKSEGGRPAKMLFFIDDLDRMKPEVAVQILEVMKNLFDIENCVFVLSLDWNVVVKGLKLKFGEMTDSNAHEFHDFFCKQHPRLMPLCRSISQLLNLLWNRLNVVQSNASIGSRLRKLLMISSITSIKGRCDVVGVEGNANVQAALHYMRRNVLELRNDRGGYLNTTLQYVDFAARQKCHKKDGEDYMRVGALVKQSTDDEPSKRVAVEMEIHFDENSLGRRYVIMGRVIGYDWERKCPLPLDFGVSQVKTLLKGMSDNFSNCFLAYPVAKKWEIWCNFDESQGLSYRIGIPYGQELPLNDLKEAVQGAFNAMGKDLLELAPYLP